jgi:hypothetical protein
MSTKRVGLLFALLLAVTAAPGCAAISVLSYRQDPASGVPNQTTTVHLIGRPGAVGGAGSQPDQPLDRTEIDALGPEFAKGLAECGVTVPPPPPPGALPLPFLLPLVGFAVQQGVDYGTGLVAERAKTIEDASTRTYDARVIVGDPARFAAGECLLVLRRGPRAASETTGADINMVALLRMERVGVSPGPTRSSSGRCSCGWTTRSPGPPPASRSRWRWRWRARGRAPTRTRTTRLSYSRRAP